MLDLYGRKIIVYGLGKEYEKQKKLLEKCFSIVAYTDKKEKDICLYIDREKIQTTEYDYIYITSNRFFDDIKSELVDLLGVSEDRIISAKNIWENIAYYMDGIGSVHIQVPDGVVDVQKYNTDIYTPSYHVCGILNGGEEPDIYNRQGEKVRTFFLRNIHTAHDPYYMNNKYFIWDRFNYGLNTHFYSHRAILETMGKPTKKYALFEESRVITPVDYDILFENKGLYKEFDAIFTFDDVLLDAFPNAKLLPVASSWYGQNNKELPLRADNYRYKNKKVSILASNKELCELHILRKELARRCQREQLADAYGLAVGKYAKIEEPYEKYMFSIVIENDTSSYYFTEKLTTCLEAQTIPIYLGASKVHEFFNTDGMIIISKDDVENIDKIIERCTEQYYMEHIEAVLDNYKRVKKYENVGEYLYENYLMM